MTYEFEIDPEHRLMIERWTGDITLEALLHGLETIEKRGGTRLATSAWASRRRTLREIQLSYTQLE